MLQAPWVHAVAAAVHVLVLADAVDVPGAVGTLDLSNRAEARVRDIAPLPAGTPSPSVDLVDIASARAGLTTHRWAYTLGYQAMGMALDTEVSVTPQLLQFADVGATWHDRRVTLGVAEYGGYGRLDFAQTGPVVAPTPTGTTLPPTGVQLVQPGIVDYGSSRTVLRAADRLARRWTLTLSLEYALQGGLDGPSQALLPLVRGPRVDLALAHQWTRLDVLETDVSAQRSEASTGICSPFIPPGVLAQPTQPCAPQGQIGAALEVWRHTLSRSTTMSLGAGASVAQIRFQDSQAGYDAEVLPAATAGVLYTRRVEGKNRNARLDLAVAPFFDLRTGLVDERAQGLGILEYPTRTVLYTGSLGVTRSIASPFIEPLTSFQANIEAEYEVSRAVGVGGGVHYLWQDQEGYGTFSFAIFFAQITVRAPQQRF